MMGDRCVLGSATALRFLQSQILYRLQKSSDATTEATRVYTHAKMSHTHVNGPVIRVRVRWIIETPK